MEDEQGEKRQRGKGKGSNFFAVDRGVWLQLWSVPTTNRLNLVVTYLVLQAGTGSDHRLTKWSAKACEQYTGLGKPRAKHAIEELIAAGIVRRTDTATRMMPQYEMPALPITAEPIFLPVALVTGLANETPVLRRIRETGDPLALRMLIDLYGLIALDATHGVPIANFRDGGMPNDAATAHKILETGAHAVWGLKDGGTKNGSGDWVTIHRIESKDSTVAWTAFWQRLGVLKQISAIWYESWAFDGTQLDAEPLMPLDPTGFYSVAAPDDDAKLTRLAFDASRALVGSDRSYLFDTAPADFYIPLSAHRQEPAFRKVLRLRVEADTPGRRLSWKKRRVLMEQHVQSLTQLIQDVEAGLLNEPMRTAQVREMYL